jgi:hypothetical protein
MNRIVPVRQKENAGLKIAAAALLSFMPGQNEAS